MTTEKIRITLLKSIHGRLKSHQSCIKGLGLRKRHQTVEVLKTPENMGMVNKVSYLLKIEEM